MRKFIYLLIILISTSLISCTENSRAKSFGGTMTIDLPTGTTLVEATWKESELWYLYRERDSTEKPKTYYFKEESSFGVMEGTVVFKEY